MKVIFNLEGLEDDFIPCDDKGECVNVCPFAHPADDGSNTCSLRYIYEDEMNCYLGRAMEYTNNKKVNVYRDIQKCESFNDVIRVISDFINDILEEV